jgi:PST family polysaccharide transporter
MMAMGSAYFIRIVIANKQGLEATGLYQAAWTLGGLYVGLILQAMGADFYPRLTAAARDDEECNRLVNEQARVSMLLAGPGVLATLTFAPLVISMFYAPNFVAAVGILRWICLGIAMRVISWPLGYVLVAKGDQTRFICSDLAWTVIHIVLVFSLVGRYGLDGAGMAFFGSYVFHIILNYVLVRHLSNFQWSPETTRTAFFYMITIVAAFGSATYLTTTRGAYVGLLLLIISGTCSLRALVSIAHADRSIPHERFPYAFLLKALWIR